MIKLSYGGDWIWPDMEQEELQRLFFARLPIVAPKVTDHLATITRAVADLSLGARQPGGLIPPGVWVNGLSPQCDRLYEALRTPSVDLKAEFSHILNAVEDWIARWNLSAAWVRGGVAYDIATASPNRSPGVEPLTSSPKLSASGFSDGYDTSVLFSRHFTLEPDKNLAMTPPIVFGSGERLPAWWVIWTPRVDYEGKLMAALVEGDDDVVLDVAEAWLDRVERDLPQKGLIPAPKKHSLVHMDALIRWQCLSWPWDCVAYAQSISGKSRSDGGVRGIQDEVRALAAKMAWVIRTGKPRGRGQHHGDGCLCPITNR